MRAMAVTGDGVSRVDVPTPEPGPGDVRVRVEASAVNPGEARVIGGGLVGRFLHARTSPLVLGWDFAGTVDAHGADVTDLDEGAPVWGHLVYSPSQTQGAFAEYVAAPRETMALRPQTVSARLAAAAATISMTALQSLRDHGRLAAGDRALVIGAAGGIGSIAVGIGHRLSAHVTAVCSTKDVERVTALGADVVVDRTQSDPYDTEDVYDVVFDTPGVSSFGRCARVLRPGGTYVTTMPSLALMTGRLRALFSSKRCRFVQVAPRRADLELVAQWLTEGLAIPIDSRYKVADLSIALQRQSARDRSGRVVVDVAEGW